MEYKLTERKNPLRKERVKLHTLAVDAYIRIRVKLHTDENLSPSV
jgi:hypothetical protein